MILDRDVEEFLEALGSTGDQLQRLDRLEHWTIDNNPLFYQELVNLDKLLPQSYEKIDEFLFSNIDLWLTVLASINLPRFILTLQWIEESTDKDYLAKLFEHKPKSEDYEIEKACIFNRLERLVIENMLLEITDKSRFDAVINALNKLNEVN